MNPREHYFTLFEDLAKRNVDVAHATTTEDERRFFIEQEYNVIQAGGQLHNAGWNMLLEGYDGKVDDNGAGSTPLLLRTAFSILKHAEREDSAAHTAAYNGAWAIGWEILLHLRAVCENRAQAVANDWISAGVNIPSHVIGASIEFLDVGPRFDYFFGVRFSFDIRQHCDLPSARDPVKWRSLS